MRYRITFHAKQDHEFNWETNEQFEADNLMELIFKFQLWIVFEFNKILDRSKEMMQPKVDDDIPF